MNTNEQAAEQAKKMYDMLSNPNSEMQNQISSIRGMMGDVYNLTGDHRDKVCHYLLDLFLHNDVTIEAMIGFLVGGLYDLYVKKFNNNWLFMCFPELKKLVSNEPTKVLQDIIKKTE